MNQLEVKKIAFKNIQPSDKIITDILALQQQHISSRNDASSENGFLISKFDTDELASILKTGILYYATYSNRMIGYLLMAGINHFTELFEPSNRLEIAPFGEFNTNIDFNWDNYTYLYQIATDKSLRHLKVGGLLLKNAMEETQKDILSDILIDPVKNKKSIDFFVHKGFEKVGILKLAGYRDFGPLISEVYVWKR